MINWTKNMCMAPVIQISHHTNQDVPEQESSNKQTACCAGLAAQGLLDCTPQSHDN